MQEIVFHVERPFCHQLIARAAAGNRSIDARAASSIDLHRRARQTLRDSLGERHSECRILFEKRYAGLESLRCTFRSFLESGE